MTILWEANWREKAFIAWIGPKGIVAAAVASLFSLYLLSDKINLPEELRSDVELLVPLTFMIILGTVTLNGLSAKTVAKLLGVIGEDKNGFLIVGANEGSISIAKYLENKGFPTKLIDLSSENVRHAKAEGLIAEERNILAEENADLNLEDVGYVLALTSSNDVNIFACRKLKIDIGDRIFRLITGNEIKFSALTRPKNILFGENTDYIEFIELIRRYPDIQETKIDSQEHLEKMINTSSEDFIPLLVQRGSNIIMITVRFDYQFIKGDTLAYIGKFN